MQSVKAPTLTSSTGNVFSTNVFSAKEIIKLLNYYLLPFCHAVQVRNDDDNDVM